MNRSTEVPSRIHNHTAYLALICFLAAIGLIDATYLTINHLNGVYLSCSGSACDEVLNSQFSMFGVVPLSVIGMTYYSTVIALGVASLKWGLWLHYVSILTTFGAAVSIYLVAVQAFILHAFCAYCMLSASVCLLLMAVSFATKAHARSSL